MITDNDNNREKSFNSNFNYRLKWLTILSFRRNQIPAPDFLSAQETYLKYERPHRHNFGIHVPIPVSGPTPVTYLNVSSSMISFVSLEKFKLIKNEKQVTL